MSSQPEKFVFLVHPLNMVDVVRYEPKAAGRSEGLVYKIFEWMPSNICAHVTGIESKTGVTAEGWFSMVPYLPRQFVTFSRELVYGKIVDACKLGQERGAKIVGLGGYTSVVGDAGVTIAERVPGLAVTSGNSYTIATALQGALEAARRLGTELESSKVAVVGASGAIGSVCARIMARSVRDLALVARNKIRLQRIAETIQQETGKICTLHTEVSEGVHDADIVITATSSTGNIITANDLKPGALVCDVSLPHDVCREVATQRPDVLVIEGGLADIPGNVDFDFDFGYPPGVALACMAETIILTLEGRFENFSLGRGIAIEQVEEITRMAARHGVKLAGFRSFDKMVTDDDIAAIRERARSRRKGAFMARPMQHLATASREVVREGAM
jgi:predicted amino acid dehydrogenase